MRSVARLFTLLITLVLLFGCTTVPQNKNIPQSKKVRIALIKYEMARNIIMHKDYKNLANAFKYLNEAKKTLKNDPRVYYLFAIAYQLRGNMNMYEFYLKKTISVDKNYFDAYNALGIYYFELKKYNDAIHMFTTLIQNPLYPNADVAFYNRALVYLKIGKITNSLNDLRNAVIFSNYSNPTYYTALINLEIKQKMYLRALRDLESMEEHLGETCYTKLRKAYCYIKIKEFGQAKAELNKIKQTYGSCYDKKNLLLKELKNDNNTND